jgi:hypothetical protein
MAEVDTVIHLVEKNLGRFLFPRSERWQQKRKTRTFLWVLIVELLLTAIVVLSIAYRDASWK